MEEFSGVIVLAYAIMSSLFHIYIYVTEPAEIGDEEILRRINALYREASLAQMLGEWTRLKDGDAKLLGRARPTGKCVSRFEEYRRSFLRRMWNSSEFMRTYKQHFTMSLNARRDHHGERNDKSMTIKDYEGLAPSQRMTMTLMTFMPCKRNVVALLILLRGRFKTATRSSVEGLAKDLEKRGFLAVDPSRRYRLGYLVDRDVLVRMAAVPMLDGVFGEVEDALELPEAMAKTADEIREVFRSKPEPPNTLNTELRPYQTDGTAGSRSSPPVASARASPTTWALARRCR